MMRLSVVGTLLALAASSLNGQGASWTIDLDAAKAQAKEQHRPLVVAVHLKDDWTIKELIKRYADRGVAKFSRQTVNVLCYANLDKAPKNWPVSKRLEEWQASEQDVRQLIGLGSDERPHVPLHVFLTPDGEIISSTVGRLTNGELEWVWADAIKRFNKSVDFKPAGRSRAPRSLTYGKLATSKADRPLNAKELAALLVKVMDMPVANLGNLVEYRGLMRSGHKEARRYAAGGFRIGKPRQGGGGRRGRQRDPEEKEESARDGLAAIAEMSPPAWWELGSYWLERGVAASTRVAAANALRSLRNPKAKSVLSKVWKNEIEDDVKAAMIRAMAACQPTSMAVSKRVNKILDGDGETSLRVAAARAAAEFEDRRFYEAGVRAALADPDAAVRIAGAWAVAWRRDAVLAQAVGQALGNENDAGAKRALEAALSALDGGDLSVFAEFGGK